MSKKINISIPNKAKPNLVDLFHEYLSRKSKEYKVREPYIWDEYSDMIEYWDQMFPGWDEGFDDDDGDVVYPPSRGSKNGKKNKNTVYDAFWQEEREERWKEKGKHKHTKGKKAKLFDINVPYSGDEDNPDEYDFGNVRLSTEDYESEKKEIWFYFDYHNKEDRLEFNSLKEFNDYCDSMGYYVEKDVADDIEWRYESHCCLNPESERIGLLEIMTAHSYGDMFYDACEEHELGD